MPIRTEILRSSYYDSVVLMRIAGQIRSRPGVREAVACMGTPANQDLLAQSGLATAETRRARPEDLILAVDADSEDGAAAALVAAHDLLTERRHVVESAGQARPRTLDAALRLLPNANVAVISVPGMYAKFEALRALRHGLHVFLFSDNVPLADEIELKREAVKRDLLCMGPDCGTAYLNGVGLGFTNVVPRGRVGIVAAAGTGLQVVASRLAALGEGISHGIGVGGRDLSADVGGLMTFFAVQALAGDQGTEAVVLISKSLHRDLLGRLDTALAGVGKPTVVCCLGAARTGTGGAVWVQTLDEAADAVAARLRGTSWSPRAFRDPVDARARLTRIRARGPVGPAVLGLYTGGTLAHEAHFILEALLGHDRPDRMLDLGDDSYTVGRPHPMIDPQTRLDAIRDGAGRREVGVLLFDLVLGRSAHPDPAAPLAAAFSAARAQAERDGRSLVGLVSVVGTPADPQGIERQVTRLLAAGMEVLPTNAEAARLAALLVRPELEPHLLQGHA